MCGLLPTAIPGRITAAASPEFTRAAPMRMTAWVPGGERRASPRVATLVVDVVFDGDDLVPLSGFSARSAPNIYLHGPLSRIAWPLGGTARVREAYGDTDECQQSCWGRQRPRPQDGPVSCWFEADRAEGAR